MILEQLESAPLDVRVAAFRQALDLDGVLSVQQARRHYGLAPSDLTGVRHSDRTAQPVHSRQGLVVQTRMYVSTSRRQSWQTPTLAHATGLAEIRHVLGVGSSARRWRIETTKRRGIRHQPDAIYQHVFGEYAVEYDTGSYRFTLIQDKLEAFKDSGLEDVVWGVPSSQRCRNLKQRSEFQNNQVILARWF